MATVVDADDLAALLGHWTSGRAALATDLAAALISLMDSGLLPAGCTLPSQRTLAGAIGVARGTVTTAYEDLAARGYVASRRGSGTQVRSVRVPLRNPGEGRLFSFTAQQAGVVDLSTGALPASDLATATLDDAEVREYLTTDGYFPAGIPVLRQRIAAQLTADGLPTSPQEALVTAGAQQATWLVFRALTAAGDLVLVEEPTYRGALEALRVQGMQLRGVPLAAGGVAVDQVRAATRAAPSLLYCQTGLHNPTGRRMAAPARRELADVITRAGLLTVEDRCSADLQLSGPAVAPALAAHADPELVITIGTMSKLFWGGLRIGWVRADAARIRGLTEILKTVQLSLSVRDQLLAARLVEQTGTARTERRRMLREHLAGTEALLREMFPDWTWEPIDGGSGLWVDTGTDAAALAQRGERMGVKLVPGPAFSVYGGQRTRLRLPVWHEARTLARGLELLAAE